MSSFPPTAPVIDGAAFSVGVVAARYNHTLVEALLARVLAGLRAAGVKENKITVIRVPGSHEVPWAAQALVTCPAGSRKGGGCDCVLALGVLVGGSTNHHELVGTSVSHALQRVALATGVPVINGVIVADTRAQAAARCTGRIARGAEFAAAALEMAALKRKFIR